MSGEMREMTWGELLADNNRLRKALASVRDLAGTKFHRYDTRDLGDAYHADGVDDLLDEIRTLLVDFQSPNERSGLVASSQVDISVRAAVGTTPEPDYGNVDSGESEQPDA